MSVKSPSRLDEGSISLGRTQSRPRRDPLTSRVYELIEAADGVEGWRSRKGFGPT